jgi:hypothetical protein
VPKTIRVIVDEARGGKGDTRNALPDLQQMLAKPAQKTVEVEASALRQSISLIYDDVVDMINNIPDKDRRFELESVSFSVVIDSEGKVSLFSAVSGSLKTQTGLTFLISRKSKK